MAGEPRPDQRCRSSHLLRRICFRLFSMTLQMFRDSLSQSQPPAGLSLALAGMWWDGKGDWKRAHESAQQDEGPAGSWVHAYLHRKEGDGSNAGYWYSRAGKPVFRIALIALF